MNDKVPPIFQIDGSGYELFFNVYEVTSERDKYGRKTLPIWAFKSKQRRAHETWVPVTYGQLPEEFEQTFPSSGTLDQLVEGKLYGAHAIIYSTSGDEVWFIIKDGKTIQVSKQD